MKQALGDKELSVLECIASMDEPIGSWFLVEKLEEKDIKVSSATIGRILNRLERFGYVEKESFKGRVITKLGREELERAKTIERINYHKNELDKMINPKVLEDYIMVLQARKAIERETARLAARNVTDSELNLMDEILLKQETNYSIGKSVAEEDVNFHKSIAKASRNNVLKSLYTIISTLGQQSKLFEYIRAQIKAPYMASHRLILKALRDHDEDKAEAFMIEHIESLIRDLIIYWDEYQEKG